MAATTPQQGHRGAVMLMGLLLLALLLPYLVAVVLGQGDPELSGRARLHSAAESIYCEDGLTPVGAILLAESALLLGAVLVARRGQRPGPVAAALREHGWHLLALLLLINTPFLLAWRAAICVRSRCAVARSIPPS